MSSIISAENQTMEKLPVSSENLTPSQSKESNNLPNISNFNSIQLQKKTLSFVSISLSYKNIQKLAAVIAMDQSTCFEIIQTLKEEFCL